MIAARAEFIDWYALQAAAMLPSIRKCARGDSKLTEAVDRYAELGIKANFRTVAVEIPVTSLKTLAGSSADTQSMAENAGTGGQIFCSGAVSKGMAKYGSRENGTKAHKGCHCKPEASAGKQFR
jgi:hypothetical protein